MKRPSPHGIAGPGKRKRESHERCEHSFFHWDDLHIRPTHPANPQIEEAVTPQEALARVAGWIRVYKNAPNRCVNWYEKDDEALAVLRAVVEERDALKAENECLSKQHDQCHDTNTELINERFELKAEGAMFCSDEVHVFWDVNSRGSHFDLGMAFALDKKIKLIKEYQKDGEGKSYVKVMKIWEKES